jgi:hypothetical protein
MDAEERRQFETLRVQVACDAHFTCIQLPLQDVCKGTYHTDLNILECLEKSPVPCKFARPFGDKMVCICPMRKFIAQNFDKWAAGSTIVLREAMK